MLDVTKNSEGDPEGSPLFFKPYISYNVRYTKYRGRENGLFPTFGFSEPFRRLGRLV